MAETTLKITDNDILLLQHSPITGKLRIFHNSVEVGSIGGLGGMTTFEIAGKKVEVQNRLTALATQEVTVRVDGNIIGQFKWI